MLTADLVHARRSAGILSLVKWSGAKRENAYRLAEIFLAIAQASIGKSREEFDRACADVLAAEERKLAGGMRKLVEDRCLFEGSDIDPTELRRELFERASAERRSLHGRLDRQTFLEQFSAERGTDTASLEELIYSDLRGAHRLRAFDPISPEELVAAYEMGQAQAVLLRAVHLTVDLLGGDPNAYRALFHKIKFLGLLYAIERLETGYRLRIDGPFSLFESVTKYGLQMALLLPTLRRCADWKLEALVRWGAAQEPLWFRLESTNEERWELYPKEEPRPEIETLLTAFSADECPWHVSIAGAILHVDGGACIPDLEFRHKTRVLTVYLELLGYWSRDAVWKRVELAQKRLSHPILFAVNKRLRVSEEVLDEESAAAIYVYANRPNPHAVLERIEKLAGRK